MDRSCMDRSWFEEKLKDLDKTLMLGKKALLHRDGKGFTFAHYAVEGVMGEGDAGVGGDRTLKTLLFLTENGAGELLVARDESGVSPAQLAARLGKHDVFEWMVGLAFDASRGFEPLRRELLAGEVLSEVVRGGATRCLRALIKHGGAEWIRKVVDFKDVRVRVREGDWTCKSGTPAVMACFHDKGEVLQALYEMGGEDVLKVRTEWVGNTGKSLHLRLAQVSALSGGAETLRYLYTLGTAGEVARGAGGTDSVLFFAASYAERECFQLVCEMEGAEKLLAARFNEAYDDQATVATMLTRRGALALIKVLTGQCGEAVLEISGEWNPLSMAMAVGARDILGYLYAVLPHPLEDSAGRTALHMALMSKKKAESLDFELRWKDVEALIRLIYEREGDEFCRQSKGGKSGLLLAVEHNQHRAIRLLHELANDMPYESFRGCDPQPYQVALKSGQERCATFLRQLGWVDTDRDFDIESEIDSGERVGWGDGREEVLRRGEKEWFEHHVLDLERLVQGEEGFRALLMMDRETGSTFAHYACEAAYEKNMGEKWLAKQLLFLQEHEAAKALLAKNTMPLSVVNMLMIHGSIDIFKWILSRAVGSSPSLDSREASDLLQEILSPYNLRFCALRDSEFLLLLAEVPQEEGNVLMQHPEVIDLLQRDFTNEEALALLYRLDLLHVNDEAEVIRFVNFVIDSESIGLFEVVCTHEARESVLSVDFDLQDEGRTVLINTATLLAFYGWLDHLKVMHKRFGRKVFRGHPDSNFDPFIAAIRQGHLEMLDFMYSVSKCPLKIARGTMTALRVALESHRELRAFPTKLEPMMRLMYKFEGEAFCRDSEVPGYSGLQSACEFDAPQAIDLMHELVGDVPFKNSANVNPTPYQIASSRRHAVCVKKLERLQWIHSQDEVREEGDTVEGMPFSEDERGTGSCEAIFREQSWFQREVRNLGALVAGEEGDGALHARDPDGCTFAHYVLCAEGELRVEMGDEWVFTALNILATHGAGDLFVAKAKSGLTPAQMLSFENGDHCQVFTWLLHAAFDSSSCLPVDVAAALGQELTSGSMICRVISADALDCLTAVGEIGGKECMMKRCVQLEDESLGTAAMCALRQDRGACIERIHKIGGKEALQIQGQTSLAEESLLRNKPNVLQSLYKIGLVPSRGESLYPEQHLTLVGLALQEGGVECFKVVCECNSMEYILGQGLIETHESPKLNEDWTAAAYLAKEGKVDHLHVLYDKFGWPVLMYGRGPLNAVRGALMRRKPDVLRFLCEVQTLEELPLLQCMSCTLAGAAVSLISEQEYPDELEAVIRLAHEFEGDSFSRQDDSSCSALHRACMNNAPRTILLLKELGGQQPFKDATGVHPTPFQLSRACGHGECMEALRKCHWDDEHGGDAWGQKVDVETDAVPSQWEVDVHDNSKFISRSNVWEDLIENDCEAQLRGLMRSDLESLSKDVRVTYINEKFGLCCEGGKLGCAKVILDAAGADYYPLRLDAMDDSPVHQAARHDRADFVELIQDAFGSECFMYLTKEGFNGAHFAANFGSLKFLKELARVLDEQTLGKVLTQKDPDGKSPADFAHKQDHVEVVKCLTELGFGRRIKGNAVEERLQKSLAKKKKQMEKGSEEPVQETDADKQKRLEEEERKAQENADALLAELDEERNKTKKQGEKQGKKGKGSRQSLDGGEKGNDGGAGNAKKKKKDKNTGGADRRQAMAGHQGTPHEDEEPDEVSSDEGAGYKGNKFALLKSEMDDDEEAGTRREQARKKKEEATRKFAKEEEARRQELQEKMKRQDEARKQREAMEMQEARERQRLLEEEQMEKDLEAVRLMEEREQAESAKRKEEEEQRKVQEVRRKETKAPKKAESNRKPTEAQHAPREAAAFAEAKRAHEGRDQKREEARKRREERAVLQKRADEANERATASRLEADKYEGTPDGARLAQIADDDQDCFLAALKALGNVAGDEDGDVDKEDPGVYVGSTVRGNLSVGQFRGVEGGECGSSQGERTLVVDSSMPPMDSFSRHSGLRGRLFRGKGMGGWHEAGFGGGKVAGDSQPKEGGVAGGEGEAKTVLVSRFGDAAPLKPGDIEVSAPTLAATQEDATHPAPLFVSPKKGFFGLQGGSYDSTPKSEGEGGGFYHPQMGSAGDQEDLKLYESLLLSGGGGDEGAAADMEYNPPNPARELGSALEFAGGGQHLAGGFGRREARQLWALGEGVVMRPEQRFGTTDYRSMWGLRMGEATPTLNPSDPSALGKGLDNPAGMNNCFLNVIIQSLWHVEGFRDGLLDAYRTKDKVRGGSDEAQRIELLDSLLEIFQGLSDRGTPPAAEDSSGPKAWGSGTGGTELFVVDPERCRKALGAIFDVHNRGQVMEMGDAAEALHDIFDALHACFVEGEGHAHSGVGAGAAPPPPPDNKEGGGEGEEGGGEGEDDEERGGGYWGTSVVSDTFGIHVTETTECTLCQFQYPSHKFTRFFQMVPFEAWREAWRQSGGNEAPEVLLKRTYHREYRHCQKCSKEREVPFEVRHNIERDRPPPGCFAILVQWLGGDVSSDDIATLLSLMPLTMDLSLVVSNIDAPTHYRLRCMICLYGAHFITIAFNPSVFQWVQYDDGKVTGLGGWDGVMEKLRKGRFQPEVCFYEKVPVRSEER